jgi:hypothetical protein
MKELLEIRAKLHAYRDLAECVVTDVQFARFGTEIKVVVDYVWNSDGTLKGETDERMSLALTFGLVQRYEMVNRLRPVHFSNPEMIDWSHCEIAMVEVVRDHDSSACEADDVTFFHCTFWWEQEAWFRLIAATLEIEEMPYAPGWLG